VCNHMLAHEQEPTCISQTCSGAAWTTIPQGHMASRASILAVWPVLFPAAWPLLFPAAIPVLLLCYVGGSFQSHCTLWADWHEEGRGKVAALDGRPLLLILLHTCAHLRSRRCGGHMVQLLPECVCVRVPKLICRRGGHMVQLLPECVCACAKAHLQAWRSYGAGLTECAHVRVCLRSYAGVEVMVQVLPDWPYLTAPQEVRHANSKGCVHRLSAVTSSHFCANRLSSMIPTHFCVHRLSSVIPSHFCLHSLSSVIPSHFCVHSLSSVIPSHVCVHNLSSVIPSHFCTPSILCDACTSRGEAC